MFRVVSVVRFLALLFVACAAPPPAANVAVPVVPVQAEAKPPPPTFHPAVTDLECERVALPPMRSLIVIPGEVLTRAMVPVIHAACSCTRAGTQTRVIATMRPELGSVAARAPDDEGIDQCMQRVGFATYTPFQIGSDCIGCGARQYGVFHGSAPPAPPPSAIITSRSASRTLDGPLNDLRDVVGDSIPKPRRQVVPHALDRDELCARNCGGSCSPATHVAQRVCHAVDDERGNVEG